MRTLVALLFGGGLLLTSWSARAQTWADGRTTPALGEIVAVDATGETGWLYGFEDLAGDGQEFRQQEQSIDIRTAYASADATRFWARVYVSDPNAAGGNVTVYVFVDSDDSATTGGGADATEIDPRFTTDPTPGGFDYVIEVGGNGAINDIWQWMPMMSQYVAGGMVPAGAEAETGQDGDPIEINGSDHGYVQSMVDLALVGLTEACDANLYFRSVITAGSMGDGDLEVGVYAPCIPADANGDGVPDVLIPPNGCTSDAECPGNGICVNGECLVPQPCLNDADCDPDEQCGADNICRPRPAGPCSDNADCGDLVCRDSICNPCQSDDECGAGRICGPDGRCIGDPNNLVQLGPDERAQGGALTCTLAPRERSGAALWALLLAGLCAITRRAGSAKRRGAQ